MNPRLIGALLVGGAGLLLWLTSGKKRASVPTEKPQVVETPPSEETTPPIDEPEPEALAPDEPNA